MASVPTEVVRVSEVAGNGPPCTMAWPTSTPVGQPLTRMRPALRSRMGSTAATASWSASFSCRVAVSWPSSLDSAVARSAASS